VNSCRIFGQASLVLLLVLATHAFSAENKGSTEECYVVSGLDLDGQVYRIQGWLELYGAMTQVSPTPVVTLLLYLPPFENASAALRVIDRLKEFPEFLKMSLITQGTRKHGISFGLYAQAIPPSLLDRLRQLGYSPRVARVYDEYSPPALFVRQANQVSRKAFEQRFPLHRLISVDCQ